MPRLRQRRVQCTSGVATMDCPHKDDPLSDVQWDPKSPNYIIAGCRSGRFHMYDVDSSQQLQSFEQLREGGLQMIAWVPDVPGDFVTVSDKTGVIRVWNVSNRQPKDTLKAEAGPFQGISFVHGTQRALCRFKSGAVGLCDLSKRTWVMFGKAAHTDTVFNAAFQPADPNMLATCSFDGSVRIWDTKQARLFRDLVGEEVVCHAISWSPHDPTRLVACSSKGEVLLWHVEEGIIEAGARRDECAALPSLLLRLGHRRPDRRVRAGGAVVLSPDGTVITCATQTRRSASRGIQPTRRSSRAPARTASCGCAVQGGARPTYGGRRLGDSSRRAYERSSGWLGALPPDLLMSGSDDTTVRIWDTSIARRACSPATRTTRALHWSYEVPWLCFSGAWDGTIRVWDIRSCTCLQVLADHHADVYSLVSHPMRPAVLLSTSRDTTIRTWSLVDMMSAISLPLTLALSSLPEHTRNSRQAMEALVQPLLCGDAHAELASGSLLPQACCGSGGRLLADRLISLSVGGSRLELLTCLLDFCHPPRGMANLWALLSSLLAEGHGGGGGYGGGGGGSSANGERQSHGIGGHGTLQVPLHELEVCSANDTLHGAWAQLTQLLEEKDRGGPAWSAMGSIGGGSSRKIGCAWRRRMRCSWGRWSAT